MPITKTDPLPYEILFRFDEQTGALKGCHFCSLVSIVEDGVTIATTVGDAQPVSLGATGVGLKLADVLGTLAAAQQTKLDEQMTTITTQTAELTAKDATAQDLLEQLATMTAARDRLHIVMDGVHAEVNPPEPEAPTP